MAAAELTNIRIRSDDLCRLRLIAAITDQRLYEVVSRLLKSETTRLDLEPMMHGRAQHGRLG